jgi:stress-induced morphogen
MTAIPYLLTSAPKPGNCKENLQVRSGGRIDASALRSTLATGGVWITRHRLPKVDKMPSPDTLKSLLVAAFPDARVEVTDLTGTKDHFQAIVVTRAFDGKTRIEQHQMVYAALGELMAGDIHALALTTRVS